MEKSIDKAKEINLDKEANTAQNLDEYYGFIEASFKECNGIF